MASKRLVAGDGSNTTEPRRPARFGRGTRSRQTTRSSAGFHVSTQRITSHVGSGSLRHRVALFAPGRVLHDIARALGAHQSVDLVLAATSVDDCRMRLEARAPAVIVIIAPAERLGQVVREARAVLPEVAMAACGTSGDDSRDLAVAVRLAVSGFVGAQAPIRTLVDVIASVARGEVRYATPSAGALLQQLTATTDSAHYPRAIPLLTAREQEIASLMSTHSNRAIADVLGVELSTVKNHVHNILSKLLVRHRREAADLVRTPHDHARMERGADLDPFDG